MPKFITLPISNPHNPTVYLNIDHITSVLAVSSEKCYVYTIGNCEGFYCVELSAETLMGMIMEIVNA